MEIRELGQGALIRLIMVLAIPEDRKLGQVDLINPVWEIVCLVDPNSTPAKGKVFPYLPGFSVHLSAVEPGFLGNENKGNQ